MPEKTGGEWLREQLDLRGLKVRVVADSVGVGSQAVYNWLADKTAPSDVAATTLAVMLDLPIIEVRQRFGLWVPGDDQHEPTPKVDRETFAEMRRTLAELEAQLAQLERDEERRRRAE